jgi:hypothetical protein
MTANHKRRILIFLSLAALAMALLATALPQIELKLGVPLPAQSGNPGDQSTNQAPGFAISISTGVMAFLGFSLFAAGLYILYKLFKGVHWSQTLIPAIILAIAATGVLYVLFSVFKVQVEKKTVMEETLPPDMFFTGPLLGPTPRSLTWLVWVGLGALVLTLGIWLLRRPAKLPALEREAEKAMQALRDGSDLQDVIVHCYTQMSLALQQEQGIELGEAMTAREFERLLDEKGFPDAPVHELTRLFEIARYGQRKPGPQDEQKALGCLDAIVQHSRLARGEGV